MNKYLLCLILLLGSLFFAGSGYWAFLKVKNQVRVGSESVHWPTSEASYMGSYAKFEDGAGSSKGVFIAKVTYRYEVNSIELQNTDSVGKNSFRNREKAEAFLESYPKDNLKAYYNPEKVTESVLEPGLALGTRALFLLPIALFLAALMIIVEGIKTLFRPQPNKSNMPNPITKSTIDSSEPS